MILILFIFRSRDQPCITVLRKKILQAYILLISWFRIGKMKVILMLFVGISLTDLVLCVKRVFRWRSHPSHYNTFLCSFSFSFMAQSPRDLRTCIFHNSLPTITVSCIPFWWEFCSINLNTQPAVAIFVIFVIFGIFW